MNTKFNINNLTNLLDSVDKYPFLRNNKHIVSKIDNLMSIFETNINSNIHQLDSINKNIRLLITEDESKEITNENDIIYDIKLLMLQNNKIKELISSAKIKSKKNIYHEYFIENEAHINRLNNRKYELIQKIDNMDKIDVISDVLEKNPNIKSTKLDNYLSHIKQKKNIKVLNHNNMVKLKKLILDNQNTIDKLQYDYKLNCIKLDNEIINNKDYFSDKLNTDRGKYCSNYKHKLLEKNKINLDKNYYFKLNKLLLEKKKFKSEYLILEIPLDKENNISLNENLEHKIENLEKEQKYQIEEIKSEILEIDDKITEILLKNKENKKLYLVEESKLNNELFLNLETYSNVIDKNNKSINILNKKLENIDNNSNNKKVDKFREEISYLESSIEKNKSKFNDIKKRYNSLFDIS